MSVALRVLVVGASDLTCTVSTWCFPLKIIIIELVAHLRERHGIVKRQLQMARQRTVAEVVEHRTSDERQLLVPADRLKRNQKEVRVL